MFSSRGSKQFLKAYFNRRGFLYFKITFLVLIIFNFNICAFGRSFEEELAEQMAKKAAEAYVQDKVEDYLVNYVNEYVAKNLPNESENLGGEALLAINMLLSLKNYHEQKTPDGQVIAGADVVANGFAIYSPKVAAILKIVIFVAGVMLAATNMDHQAALMNIYGDTLAAFRESMLLNLKQAKAEFAIINGFILSANNSVHRSKAYLAFIQEKCVETEEPKSTEELMHCYSALGLYVASKRMFTDEIENLLKTNLSFFPISEIMKNLYPDLTSTEDLLSDYKAQLLKAEQAVAQYKKELTSSYIVKTYEGLLAESKLEMEKKFFMDCKSFMRKKLISASSIRLDGKNGDQDVQTYLDLKNDFAAFLNSEQFLMCRETFANEESFKRLLLTFESQVNRLSSFLDATEGAL